MRFPLGGLAALERFGDQRVGKHQLGLRHVLDRKQEFLLLAFFRVVTAEPDGLAVGAEQQCRGNVCALDAARHLDLGDMAGVAVEIRAPHQRTIEARREISSRYGWSTGSLASKTGDSAREIVSQSPTVMLPSGRSAMICTVRPDCGETCTRTSR